MVYVVYITFTIFHDKRHHFVLWLYFLDKEKIRYFVSVYVKRPMLPSSVEGSKVI